MEFQFKLRWIKVCAFAFGTFFLILNISGIGLAQEVKNWNFKKGSTLKANQLGPKGVFISWKRQLEEWGLDKSFRKSLDAGIYLNTSGVGGQFRINVDRNMLAQDVWSLKIGSINDEKEIKQQRRGSEFRNLGDFRPYSFGKINNAYVVQVGYGKEQILLPSLIDNNISISGSLILGFTIVVEKPVYLNLIYRDSSNTPYIKSEAFNVENSQLFLSNSSILGADRWIKGWKSARLVPGAFIEPSLIFFPSLNKFFIQKISIGANLSLYTRKIDMMANQGSKSFHSAFFVGFSLGKRW